MFHHSCSEGSHSAPRGTEHPAAGCLPVEVMVVDDLLVHLLITSYSVSTRICYTRRQAEGGGNDYFPGYLPVCRERCSQLCAGVVSSGTGKQCQ